MYRAVTALESWFEQVLRAMLPVWRCGVSPGLHVNYESSSAQSNSRVVSLQLRPCPHHVLNVVSASTACPHYVLFVGDIVKGTYEGGLASKRDSSVHVVHVLALCTHCPYVSGSILLVSHVCDACPCDRASRVVLLGVRRASCLALGGVQEFFIAWRGNECHDHTLLSSEALSQESAWCPKDDERKSGEAIITNSDFLTVQRSSMSMRMDLFDFSLGWFSQFFLKKGERTDAPPSPCRLPPASSSALSRVPPDWSEPSASSP